MNGIIYDVNWFVYYNQDWHTDTFDTEEEAQARAEELRAKGFEVEVQTVFQY